MPIKDKDGSVYKLRGPNPLLKEQADWDTSSIKLINLGWKSEVVSDVRNPIKEAKKNSRDIGEELGLTENPKTKAVPARDFIKEIAEPPVKKEPVKVPVKEPEPEPEPEIEIEVVYEEPSESVELNVDPNLARILKERGVEYHCAPAVGEKTHTDDLYGTSYKTTVFGEAYIFDAIVIDESDLQLQFWCVKPINKDSVIYRRIKEGGERHWRVSHVEPRTGGWLAMAMISDLNPDFS